MSFFRHLGTKSSGELINFQTGAPTNNVLEALPPGASISEYVSTAAERRAYDDKALWRARLPILIATILWLNVVVIGLCLWIKKILKPAPILITLTATTLIAAAVCLSVL